MHCTQVSVRKGLEREVPPLNVTEDGKQSVGWVTTLFKAHSRSLWLFLH